MVKFNLYLLALVALACTTTDGAATKRRCGVQSDTIPVNPAAQIAIPAVTPAPETAKPTQNPAIQIDVPSTTAPSPSSLAPSSAPPSLAPPSDNDKPGTVAPASPSSPSSPAPSLPTWVGPLVDKPTDSACYRKTYMTTKKQCGAGYNSDNLLTCWTQCPIEYPVECGMECIPQNKDCTKEILKKVTSVVTVALNAATSGVFGQLTKASKGVQIGVKCGQQLFAATKKIVAMVEQIEGGAADTTEDKVLFAVNKSDFVVYDLPAAVATCIGVPIPQGLNKAKDVTTVVQKVVNMVVGKKRSGVNLLDFATFLNTTKTEVPSATASVESLSQADGATLTALVSSGATCGTDLNSVVNKVISMVQSLKTTNPSSPTDVIKFAVLNSDLILKDLPKAATSCATATKGFSSREATATGIPSRNGIIKTVHVIIDNILGATSKDDKPVSNADFALSVADMSLDAIALIDPTGIAAMAAEFVQPICGPTIYVGDIDSGPADQALGLNTIEKAFRGSTGTWSKTGDGQLRLTFKSVDDKDVRVNILSGGKKLYEVPVKKGQTVEWSKPLSEFQGKTLYLDRWRGGILNIPGTGGGSLLAWVPNNKDGALSLNVQINPTSFSDKDRRERH